MCASRSTSTPSNDPGAAALARSDLYSFLAQAFLFPQAPLAQTWERARTAPGVLGWPELAAPLKGLPVLPLAELQHLYLRVFGHTSTPEFPPYEGEYGQAPFAQQAQAWGDIAAFHRAFGVEASGVERLDHIGVELEFMHLLAFREAYALEYHGPEKAARCREGQQRFFQEHLGRWAHHFLARLEERGPQGYYRQLSALAQGFLRREVSYLEVAIEALL